MHIKLQVRLKEMLISSPAKAQPCRAGCEGSQGTAFALPPSAPAGAEQRFAELGTQRKQESAFSAGADVFTRDVQNDLQLWFTSDQEFILLQEA